MRPIIHGKPIRGLTYSGQTIGFGSVAAGQLANITLQPVDIVITAGNPQASVLTATATGTGVLNYQWQVLTVNGFVNGTDAGNLYMAGWLTNTLTPSATVSTGEDGFVFRLLITDDLGTAITDEATMTVGA